MLLLATLAVLASALPVVTKAAIQIYDLKDQWSDTQNPNGTWSYLRGTYPDEYLLVNDPLPWVTTSYPFAPEAITKISEDSAVPGYLEPGDVSVTTDYGRVSVRWTAPANGMIDISGAGWSVPVPCGCPDDVLTFTRYLWTLTQNGSVLSSGVIDGGDRSSPIDLSSGSGGADALLHVAVQAGDEVEVAFYNTGLGGEGPAGVNFTISFTPDAVDPVAALEDLVATVAGMNLQNGIENSLDSKLDAALGALDDLNANDDAAACNSLEAFINAVEAQRGNQLTDAQANQLIAAAQQIQSALNCGE